MQDKSIGGSTKWGPISGGPHNKSQGVVSLHLDPPLPGNYPLTYHSTHGNAGRFDLKLPVHFIA